MRLLSSPPPKSATLAVSAIVVRAGTSRRGWLAAAGLVAVVPLQPQGLSTASEVLYYVGPSQQYTSISSAIAAAPSGSTILIDPGRYQEQLLVTSSLTLAAAQGGSSVIVTCATQQPYRHCLEVASGGSDGPADVTIKGIAFEHSSKSVANNYCVYAQAGRLTLEGCNISSQTGVGVGVEGAAVVLRRCSIHDCERHGVAVFGALEGGTGRCEVSDCSITRNKLNGVLVKDGGELVADNNDITGNGSHGIQLSYCSADLHQNRLSGNKQGSVALELGTVSADAQEIQEQNSLSEDVVLL